MTRLARLPAAEQGLLVEAAALTLAAGLAVKLLPFRWIAPLLGQQTQQERVDPQQVDRARLAPLARAIKSAGRNLSASCLVQALAGRTMLARRKIPCTVSIGAAPAPRGDLKAHAWLTSGAVFVVGQTEADRFPVLTTFETR